MSNFDQAVSVVLHHEGGLTNNKADPGGITNYGISLHYLQSLIAKDPSLLSLYDVDHQGDINSFDIANLDQAEAKQIYKTQWWDKNNYGAINDQVLATKILDLAVNIGATKANSLLQQAGNQVAVNPILKIDGIIGAQTISFINSLDATAILSALYKLAKMYYENLVTKHPVLQQFLNGWLNRLVDA